MNEFQSNITLNSDNRWGSKEKLLIVYFYLKEERLFTVTPLKKSHIKINKQNKYIDFISRNGKTWKAKTR